MKQNNKSKYSAAFTSGALLFNETKAIVPLLLKNNAIELIKKEVSENNVIMLNTEKSRITISREIVRRWKAVPDSLAKDFLGRDENDQKAILFYAILATYKLIFDFQANVAMKKWASINRIIERADVLLELNEIAAKDAFVDSWTDKTKTKLTTTYIAILRQLNMIDENNQLQPIIISDNLIADFIKLGETWFMEFALIPAYEIERVKKSLA